MNCGILQKNMLKVSRDSLQIEVLSLLVESQHKNHPKKKEKKKIFFTDPYHGVKQVKLFSKPLIPHGGSTIT